MSQIDHSEVVGLRANLLVPHYLMASWLYYVHDESLMTDEAYDHCCVRLDAEWEQITHPHRCWIDRASLSATTGYTIDYRRLPQIIEHAARHLLLTRQGRRL